MKKIWQRQREIDWSDVWEYLKDGEAIKIYFHDSLETLIVWGGKELLLIQNNAEEVATLHSPKSLGFDIDEKTLPVLIDTSLFENYIDNVSLIEVIDAGLALIDLD